MISNVHSFIPLDSALLKLKRSQLAGGRRRRGELSEEIMWSELGRGNRSASDHKLANLKTEFEQITNSNYWTSLILEQMKMPRGG